MTCDVFDRHLVQLPHLRMIDDRWEAIAKSLSENNSTVLLGDRIVRVAGELFKSSSNSISLWSVPSFVTMAVSDIRASHLDEQQQVLLQGPIFDVEEADMPVYTPDVRGEDCINRWPQFTATLLEYQVASLMCFPLRVGSAHVGAVTAYRDIVGAPSPEMYRDGLILTSLATEAILHMKAGSADDAYIADFQYALENDAVVQQAAGMVSEHMNIPIADAMVAIRSRAFSGSYSLSEIARAIVRRELSLEEW